MPPDATGRTQHNPRRPVPVGIPMVLQPLPPFHLPLLSHTILSLLAMLLLLQQDFLRAFTPARATSSTCLQGQVLSLSLAICSTQSVFLSSATFALLEPCKGAAIEQFAASMHLVLDLADKYPRDSLAAHILDVSPGATYAMQSSRQSKTDSI